MRKTDVDRLRRLPAIETLGKYISELQRSERVGVEGPVVAVDALLSDYVYEFPGFFFAETEARGTNEKLDFHSLTVIGR